jgi:transcriptional regulator with XRE-family HTH domain
MKQIGAIIRENRIKKSLTQQTLADHLSVTKQAVSKWENDHGLPDITIIEPLALCLDIPIDLLIGTTKHKKKVNLMLLLTYLLVICLSIYLSLYLIKEVKMIQYVHGVEEKIGFDLPRAESYQVFDFNHLIIYGNHISITQMGYVIFKDNDQSKAFEEHLMSHIYFQEIDLDHDFSFVPNDISSYLKQGDYYMVKEENDYYILFIYQMNHHRLLIFEYVQ